MAYAATTQSAVIVVPVADVWSRPLAPGEKPADALRETQVLLGERVVVHESSGNWVRIEAVEQPEYTHHNAWEGYPGWILRSATVAAPFQPTSVVTAPWLSIQGTSGRAPWMLFLPLGSKIKPQGPGHQGMTSIEMPNGTAGAASFEGTLDDIHPRVVRIVESATKLLGADYVWGGLTPRNPLPASALNKGEVSRYGVDCSGLVHLAFRANGLTIPRDAHEQWMKAKPIQRADLKPGDLIFSAKTGNPKKITHVALYAGDGRLIEAPQTGWVVRQISFQEKFGQELSRVESGQTVGERVVYFGRLLP